MKTKSTCPSCKAILAFDRAVFSVVECPECKYKGSVDHFKEKEPETEIKGDTGKLYKPGKLEWMESDAQWLQQEKIVDLKRGINTLGRMSPNSTSSIQLPTDDSFMSKDHAIIDVIMKTDGVFEHRLSDWKSKNGTFHNGDRLEKGDVIKLMPDDMVRLGHTYFKFIPE